MAIVGNLGVLRRLQVFASSIGFLQLLASPACGTAPGAEQNASSDQGAMTSAVHASGGSVATSGSSGPRATPLAGSVATQAGSNAALTTQADLPSAQAGAAGSATAQAGSSSSPSARAGAGGAAAVSGDAGSRANAAGSAAAGMSLQAPVPDTKSTIAISRPGSQYHVEGNIPYGPLPAQRLDVMYPMGAGPTGNTTLPGVIMFHGGGWIEGDKQTMSSFYNRFLAHGFLVCSVEYRVADGSATGAIAPAAVEDALLAAKWFWDYLDYYHVDRARYIVTGASAGGHLAMMVGMATPDAKLGPTSPTDYKIAAIVNGYGPPDVSDLLKRGTSFAVQWLPASTPDRDMLALRVSPLSYARADIPPLITVQGAKDNTVPVAENQNLDKVLKAAGADAELHLVPGAGHGFSTPDTAYPDAEKAIFDFLTKHGIGK